MVGGWLLEGISSGDHTNKYGSVKRMNMTRLGLSLCFAFYSFVLFYATTGVHEIAHDQLDGKPLPSLAVVSQIFDPIGFLLVIFPFLVGFASWRTLDPVKPSFQVMLTHGLLVGFVAVIFVSVSLGTGFLTYLNGAHPVTGPRIVGNIFIGTGLLTVIARSYIHPARSEHSGEGKPVQF
jgi:hypothetical protein